MKQKVLSKTAVFNIALIVINILCFSKGFLGLSVFEGSALVRAAGFTVIIMSVFCFFYVNYKFLSSAPIRHSFSVESIKTLEDCLPVLNENRHKDFYLAQIEEAAGQIGRMTRKKQLLDNVLYQKFQEDQMASLGFREVTGDANYLLLKNIKTFINVMVVFDEQEYRGYMNNHQKIPDSKAEIYYENQAYVRELLQKNETILLDFDRLLLEISKIGDTEEADEVNLKRIGDIVSGLKSLRLNEDSELEKKYASPNEAAPHRSSAETR